MWYFNSPKIVFGEDAIQELSIIEGKRAYIVTDDMMVNLGYTLIVIDQLEQAGIQHEVFSEVEPDPSIHTVIKCANKINKFKPDWIIGLGGGSCLDAAKAAWFLYECPDTPLDAINPFEQFGLRAKASFATISTTSGTGADVSWGFALNDTESRTKLVRVSRELIPDLAIVDPIFVKSMPSQITADVGMDVLAHAVEAYTNNWHNDFTDALALKAIELVFHFLPICYQEGNNLDAREHMHNAATIAGIAFSNTAIILAHSLAHAVGANFHTHHGRTVGLFLPYTIEFNAVVSPQRYGEIARFLHLHAVDSAEGTEVFVDSIRQLAAELNQPLKLADFGITQNDFEKVLPQMVENVLSSLELLANPRQPTPQQVYQLFQYAYIGKRIDF